MNRSNIARAAAFLFVLSACEVAVIAAPRPQDGGRGGLPDGVRGQFDAEVRPLLEARCISCHGLEGGAPAFLNPADLYTSVLAYENLVIPGDPEASLLLSKGAHDGPAWGGPDRETISRWITAEGENPIGPRQDAGSVAQTEPMAVTLGALNRIPLDDLGFAGSAVQFTANSNASGLFLTDVEVTAGAGGIALSAPRFVMFDAEGSETLDEDRFATTEVRVAAGDSQTLVGSMILVGYPPDGTLAMRFASIGAL